MRQYINLKLYIIVINILAFLLIFINNLIKVYKIAFSKILIIT
jgi:hypothetical protein